MPLIIYRCEIYLCSNLKHLTKNVKIILTIIKFHLELNCIKNKENILTHILAPYEKKITFIKTCLQPPGLYCSEFENGSHRQETVASRPLLRWRGKGLHERPRMLINQVNHKPLKKQNPTFVPKVCRKLSVSQTALRNRPLCYCM